MDINYTEITDRMKAAGKLKNDSAVARELGVTPQALSNYKKRGRMPMNLVLKFATIHSLSMDWLLTGEGKPYKGGFEGEGHLLAMEETKTYGKEELKKITSFAQLNADEIIYVGKLLKVLRSGSNPTVTAAKCSIDGFIKAIEMHEEQKGAGGEGGATRPTEGQGEG